jgi:AcrR family transcriptional regulator
VGRPKKFKRDEVLKNAMVLFWKRGFADTGLQDIEKATGVNKSGLYSEFKDKEDIFVSSLQYYYENRRSERLLAEEPLGWNNIENFFKFVCQGWAGEKGCFGVNSMRELNSLPPKANQIVSDSRVFLKRFFEQNIAAEQIKTPPGILSDIAVTFFSGICIEENLKTPQDLQISKIEHFINALRAM